MNHEWIIKFLRNDIADENLIRYIIRFLKAGIMDKGIMQESTLGAPQGGLCLALHNPPYAEIDVMPTKAA